MPSMPTLDSLAPLNRGAAGQPPRVVVPPPRRRWATRLLLPAAIFTATAALLAFAARDALLPATPVTTVRVVAKPVSTSAGMAASSGPAGGAQTSDIVAQAPGWVEPDPFPLYVSALAPGVVKDVLVLEGQPVKRNQVVALLIDDDAKLALQRSQAEVDRRQAMLEAAQIEWDNPVNRRRMVAVAAAMLAESQAELAQVDAMIVAEKAKVGDVLAAYDRIKALGAGAASALDIEQAKFKLESQRASADAATKQRAVVEAKIARANAELAAAQRDLELRIAEKKELDVSKAELADAQAALAEAKLRLTRMEVTSPFDGNVMTRIASPGSKLMLEGNEMTSALVVALYEPAKLQVRADVPLGDAAKVGVGQMAQIIVDVLPDRVFAGRVTRVVHQADIGKNTLQVKVAIADPTPQLKPEMLARVKFLAMAKAEDPDAPRRTELRAFIPRDAVGHAAPGSEVAVWTVDETGGTARRRMVRLSSRQDAGTWVEVAAGLNPGDAVILDPPASLRDGSRVRPAERGDIAAPQPPTTSDGGDDPAMARLIADYPLKTCVVSNVTLGDHGKPFDILYEDRLVRFCCSACLKEFNADPAKYVAKIGAAKKS